MKRVYQLRTLFFLVTAVLGMTLFNACNSDDGPMDPNDPTINGPTTSSTLISASTISAGDTVVVTFTGSKGDNQMNAIEVRRGGVKVDLAELFFNGEAAASNPRLLFADEKDDFTYTIGVLPHAAGDADYDFIVTDEASQTSTQFHTVSIAIEATDPEITLSEPGAYIAPADMLAGFEITVDANGVDLSTIEVQRAGVAIAIIDSDELYLLNVHLDNAFTANPYNVPAAYVGGMTDLDIFVRAQLTSSTTETYTVIVTNVNGEMDSQDFTIMTSGTDIDATYTGVLVQNAAGPNPNGGMDLSTGMNTPVASADADIIDQGIDGNGDWLQQIGTFNGSALKSLSQAQIDAGFVFDNVLFKEEIVQAWNGGTDVVGGITGTVQEGDVFIANAQGNDFYVIKCTNITSTGADNLDTYLFDIKKADF